MQAISRAGRFIPEAKSLCHAIAWLLPFHPEGDHSLSEKKGSLK